MKSIDELHDEAMEFAGEAFYARIHQDLPNFEKYSRKAFELEAQAAKLIESDLSPDAEPSRSVLHRSAATLAFDCGEYREAERLITTGLAGNPPQEIAQEFRELQEQVNASRMSAKKASN